MNMNISELQPFGSEWVIKERIGSGTYGTVYRAEKNTMGTVYECAIKHISIPPKGFDTYQFISSGQASDERSIMVLYQEMIRQFKNEIDICLHLKANNIVSYEDHNIFPKNDTSGYNIFIKMELLKPLEKVISPNGFSESEVVQLGIDICSALEVLESHHIIHRDIKPANIFVSDNGEKTVYKLGDFGEAKVLSGIANTMTLRGSYPYMSTEIFQRSPNADIRADIYSLGMVMFRLLNNNRGPFLDPYSRIVNSDDISKSDSRRLNGEDFNVAPCNCTNKTLSDAILKACRANPDERWRSPSEFKSVLLFIQNSDIMKKNDETIRVDMLNRTNPVTGSTHQNKAPIGNVSEYIFQDPDPKSKTPSTYEKQNKLKIIPIVLATILITVLVIFVGSRFINFELIADTKADSETDSKTDSSTVTETAAPSEPPLLSNDQIEQSVTAPAVSYTSSDYQPELSESISTPAESIPTVNKVKVVSYINRPFEDAKSQLQQTGLIVGQPEYEYSTEVDAGNVMKQSISAGNDVEENTIITLTVSRGPNFNSVPNNCRQVLNVVSSGSDATMTLYDLSEIGWIKVFSCRATVGQSGVGSNYGENKKVTPKGTFPLGVVLSRNRLTYGMEWQPCSSSTVIVEDVDSRYYNQIKDKSELPSGTDYDPIGERLNNGENNACIFIEHNGNGYNSYGVTKGAGSSITICGCNNSIAATWGCIDISANDMNKLLDFLSSSNQPYIKTE